MSLSSDCGTSCFPTNPEVMRMDPTLGSLSFYYQSLPYHQELFEQDMLCLEENKKQGLLKTRGDTTLGTHRDRKNGFRCAHFNVVTSKDSRKPQKLDKRWILKLHDGKVLRISDTTLIFTFQTQIQSLW